MPKDSRMLASIAETLRHAENEMTPIAPLTESYPNFDEDDAYEVQWLGAAAKLKQGHRIVGYKIGLTSREAQKHFQVFKPDFGHLFESMDITDSSEAPLSTLIQPKIEAEIAFVLARDMQGPGVTAATAMASIDYVCGALEIIDSRIQDWKIRAADTMADNGSSARFVLAPQKTSLSNIDLATVGMNLYRNSEIEITAAGSAVMGNPINALVFLANELGSRNIGLKAGQIVLSGSLGGMLPIRTNDHFAAEFLKLGRARVIFR